MKRPHASKRTLSTFDGLSDLERPKHLGRDNSLAERARRIKVAATKPEVTWTGRMGEYVSSRGHVAESKFVHGELVWTLRGPDIDRGCKYATLTEAIIVAEQASAGGAR